MHAPNERDLLGRAQSREDVKNAELEVIGDDLRCLRTGVANDCYGLVERKWIGRFLLHLRIGSGDAVAH
jgi:hypothetical protein